MEGKCILCIPFFTGNHMEAQEYCRSTGGSINIIHSETENEALTQKLVQTVLDYIAVGCSDIVCEGYWVCGEGVLPWYYNVDGTCNGYWGRSMFVCLSAFACFVCLFVCITGCYKETCQ